MRISVGHSAEQDTRAAASRAATTAAEGIEGLPASLAVLLVSAEHGDRAGVALDAVRGVLEPDALVGCVTDGLVAGNREVESGPAIAVWVASLPDRAETFHMEFVRTSSGGLLAGYHFTRARGDFHLLLADPYTFPADLLLEHLNAHLPGTLVMGGLVGGGRGPGGSVLFCDDKVLTSGAVGVRLPGWQGVPVVSQGCRPIGEPYTVTGADTGMLSGLGGRPPLERLRDAVATLPAEQHELARHGVQLGIVVDEYLEEPSRGDFLIRAILGVDESTGALRVGEDVAVGDTVRFQIRDAAGADEDLRENLRRARARLAGRPAGALLFTCNGRGRGMFAVADHDAGAISDVLGDIPLAGYFAAGEMGPVGGRNALHGYTASLALFDDR